MIKQFSMMQKMMKRMSRPGKKGRGMQMPFMG